MAKPDPYVLLSQAERKIGYVRRYHQGKQQKVVAKLEDRHATELATLRVNHGKAIALLNYLMLDLNALNLSHITKAQRDQLKRGIKDVRELLSPDQIDNARR